MAGHRRRASLHSVFSLGCRRNRSRYTVPSKDLSRREFPDSRTLASVRSAALSLFRARARARRDPHEIRLSFDDDPLEDVRDAPLTHFWTDDLAIAVETFACGRDLARPTFRRRKSSLSVVVSWNPDSMAESRAADPSRRRARDDRKSDEWQITNATPSTASPRTMMVLGSMIFARVRERSLRWTAQQAGPADCTSLTA